MTSMGFQFTSTLDNFEHPLMGYMLTVYEQWDKGSMPFSGSLTEQPNKVVEMMGLISGLKAEQLDKSRKKQEQQMKRK